MAANFASIKLSSEFVQEAKREAEVLQRSVGAQVEYWAKLGRAIENTPGFGVDAARQVIGGRLRVEALPTGDGQALFLNQLGAEFDSPDASVHAYYAELGQREGAVGSDGRGGVVRRQTAGRHRSVG